MTFLSGLTPGAQLTFQMKAFFQYIYSRGTIYDPVTRPIALTVSRLSPT